MHLDENLQAMNVDLTPADLTDIEGALSRVTVHGAG